jgi:multiple sugar transport system ATP-binding protein
VTAATEDAGGDMRLLADDERARFIAVLDGRSAPVRGEPVGFRVDHARLHFFDPVSGAALGRSAGEPATAPAATA